MTRRIILAGGSGLIGRALHEALTGRGEEVHTLVRRRPENDREHSWDPAANELDPAVLAGADAVISLNGASVGRLPWTKSYRQKLRDSRLSSTRTIANAIRELGDAAPAAWLSGSAVGYYGSAPGQKLTESAGPGETFLAELCVEWEAAARAAAPHTRVALLRTAPVLHPQGVLKPMILLTRFGLGGPLGAGTQHWPWISLDDEVGGILHTLDAQLEGPVNLTGPTPATANDVGRALARQLRRPFLLPAPRFALNLGIGKAAAESLLTADADVRPRALLESGYEFHHLTPTSAITDAMA